jgi:hypothetical protein
MRIMPTVGILAALLVVTQTPAQAQADFYKGKTVNVVVGARAVGSLSLSAQILARHWGRYIPGNPTVVLRQMPGGAHLNATNHVFNVAEPDGLTILAANPQVAMAQLFKMPAVRFDARQFIWIGSSGSDAALFAIHPALADNYIGLFAQRLDLLHAAGFGDLFQGVDFRENAPHIQCSVVMPGHIGTAIGANTRRILRCSGDAADIRLELFADEAGRSLTGPEAGQLGLGLKRGDDLSRFRLHLFHRDGDV